MSNIDTINVGGLDFSVEDSEARDIATGAVNVSAYVENGNTASRAYPTIGTPINWKGSLYYTKATITAGSTLSTATNLTAAANLGAMIRNIKTYVGTDSKLHFTDATGADSVLPFSSKPELLGTLGSTFDLSSYSGYQQFTSANFFVQVASASASAGAASISRWTDGSGRDATMSDAWTASGTASKNSFFSYNASTGVLTTTKTASSTYTLYGRNRYDSSDVHNASASLSVTVNGNVYLIR